MCSQLWQIPCLSWCKHGAPFSSNYYIKLVLHNQLGFLQTLKTISGSEGNIMTPGLIRNSHCFFMSLNLPLVKWRISLGHPRTPPVSVLLISRHPSAGGVKVLNWLSPQPTTPHSPSFLSFYNLMLSRLFFSALMNTLQSPVMEQRPELVSFPRSNHQQSNRTSQTGAGTRSDKATHSLADLLWSHSHSVLIL